MAVGHEPEGGKRLLLGDLSDVVPELFVGVARVAGGSLGFHDREHVAACVVQAVVGNAVPRLRIIAVNWNLLPDLGAVVESPVSRSQLRVDLQRTGLGFAESHGVKYQMSACRVVSYAVIAITLSLAILVLFWCGNAAFAIHSENAKSVIAVDQAKQPRITHLLGIRTHHTAHSRSDFVTML